MNNHQAFMSNEDIGIHAVSTADASFLMNLRNDPSTWQFLETIAPLTIESQTRWIESLAKNNAVYYFVLKNKDVSIGVIRCTNIDFIHGSACVGVDIASEHRGKGYSKIAFNLILEFIFNKLNLHRAYLYVLDDNSIAKNLYKKLGFIVEGKCREAIMRDSVRQDYLLMGMLNHEYRK